MTLGPTSRKLQVRGAWKVLGALSFINLTNNATSNNKGPPNLPSCTLPQLLYARRQLSKIHACTVVSYSAELTHTSTSYVPSARLLTVLTQQCSAGLISQACSSAITIPRSASAPFLPCKLGWSGEGKRSLHYIALSPPRHLRHVFPTQEKSPNNTTHGTACEDGPPSERPAQI